MADKDLGNGWMLLGEPGYPRPNLRCEKLDLWLEMDKDGDLEVMCDDIHERFTKFIPVSALVELLRANGYTVTKDQSPCGRDDCPSLLNYSHSEAVKLVGDGT